MFVLPDLPYGYGALEPVISERTMRFHHDKHHAAYVKTTNDLLANDGHGPLEDVIREAHARQDARKLYNNAAQAWNHAFFWAAMTPRREEPTGDLAAAIKSDFGDLAGLKTKFVAEGADHFGSGWVWLAADDAGKLIVRAMHDADDTLTAPGLTPLLVCDVWEHAYYLDHQNDRRGFLTAWFDSLPNWSFAVSQYAAAAGDGAPWKYPAAGPQAALKRAG